MTRRTPLSFPARTPLPTEQERYLDMLLMVREAMREASRWYYGMENWQLATLTQSLATLCAGVAAAALAGAHEDEVANYIVDATSEEWVGFIRAQDALANVSKSVAAMAN